MPKDSIEQHANKFNQLKSIFDALPDGIVAILDKNMKIVAANKAISQLFNLTDKKIIGKPVNELLEEKNSVLLDVVKQTVSTKKPVRNYTLEFNHKNGIKNTLLVSTSILQEVFSKDGAIVLILHDITEVTRLRKMATQLQRFGEIIGASQPMRDIYSTIETIKDYDTSVLVIGETGTGKELVARAIHNVSKRKNSPFIPVNCSALPPNLIESELFGHIKGAFTGAISDRIGRFQMAQNGTLFLDELGALSPEIQVKLLRVLQNKIIEPVGSSKSYPIDVRIISASNRDLTELSHRNEFREDLLYRLNVFKITLPPLRTRKEDIPLLINHFIGRLNAYYNKNILGVSTSTLNVLTNYPWPGNVRELENVVEHSFVLTTGKVIESYSLPIELQYYESNDSVAPPPKRDLGTEEENIRKILLSTNGNLEKASTILNIHRSTLWRKMKEFRIPKGFGKR
jgi:PAS domain S-box-containing protein